MDQTTLKTSQEDNISWALMKWYKTSNREELIQDFLQVIEKSPFNSLLNYTFKDPELLLMVFSHRSALHEAPNLGLASNERLEFLGDSILQLHISQVLFQQFPTLPEGELSRLRSALVNSQMLSLLGRLCHLDELILVGKGVLQLDSSKWDSLISDTYEALLGALLLEGSAELAGKFIKRSIHLYEEYSGSSFYSLSHLQTVDQKGRLQEWCVSQFKSMPIYECQEIDQGHFKVTLKVGPDYSNSLEGNSKKGLQKELASNAVKELKIDYK